VFEYLRAERPEALPDAERALRCFEPYGEDPERYARATRLVPTACEQEVVDLLRTMHRVARDGASSSDFEALQDAWVVEGAERYYRAMVRADNESWNVRDCHMVETLDRLVAHHGGGKAVVWEHNTHVGDARATDMARAGMVNVGQVVRERHDDEGVVIVGFSGHHGHVIAAQSWGAPTRQLPVPRAPAGTHEDLLAQVAPDPSLLVFPDERDSAWLGSSRGHRAIGVVYRPERDAFGNWVPTVMGRRYDALCSFGTTHALHPLAGSEHATGGEAETYPWAV
jgi:erythromycin esterase-like protein